MATQNFFDEASEASKTKAAIVSEYFSVWSSIILSNKNVDKIAYIDLYCGPGVYNDGTHSTPLQIITKAINSPTLSKKLVLSFNDKEKANIERLQQEIDRLENIKNIADNITYNNDEIEDTIAEMFQNVNIVPSLVFVDPFGYKGLSLKLLSALFKDWGCDCVFFFNYNRINMAITNPKVEDYMTSLFGKARFNDLRARYAKSNNPQERESMILEALRVSIKEKGGEYFLPFKFWKDEDNKTSHHLIFISKHQKGYTMMKEIMGKYSLSDADGIPYLEYHIERVNSGEAASPQLSLFGDDESFKPAGRMKHLKNELLQHFKGKTLTVAAVIEEHHINKPYLARNYKEALKQLEKDNIVAVTPLAKDRRKNKGVLTLANACIVKFP
ncbi:MAG: hypothetical protein JWO09_137 [Bacteroidetes bacterium]|nr:hypothetical protein [Bacteroidota bacterium]